MPKRLVEVEVCVPGLKTFIIKGRLLGLINDKELTHLLKNEDLQRKTLTTESEDVFDLFEEFDALNGKRIMFAVREEDGKPINKMLFVSGPMDMVAAYSRQDKWVYVAGPKSDLSITEVENNETDRNKT